jgi:hypothetical protein
LLTPALAGRTSYFCLKKRTSAGVYMFESNDFSNAVRVDSGEADADAEKQE